MEAPRCKICSEPIRYAKIDGYTVRIGDYKADGESFHDTVVYFECANGHITKASDYEK